ncbi:MAG: hypothetical protein QM731_15510 [Chitinophagaceae bacterium]
MKQLIAVILVSSIVSKAQVHIEGKARVQPSDMKKLEGSWLGFLFYKDYQSGEMQRIHSSVNAKQLSANTWILEYDYPREPGHKSTSSYVLSPAGDSLNGMLVIERKALPGGGITFTTESKGKDGNQGFEALFHHVWTVQGDSLLITKLVKYENEDTFFIRNTYRLGAVR